MKELQDHVTKVIVQYENKMIITLCLSLKVGVEKEKEREMFRFIVYLIP